MFRKRTLALILPCAIAIVSAADAGAAILKVPQQFATIQAAVDAASSGDTIRVSAGIYREEVVILNKTLRLEAKGNAIIEGRTNGMNLGPAIDISGASAGTVLKGLTIRLCMNTGLFGTGISAQGSDFVFEKIRVLGCGGPGFQLNGVNITLRKCVIDGCDGGITGTTSGLLIDACVVRNDAGRGIRVAGADFLIRKCVVDNIDTGIGLDIQGFSGTIEKCVVRRVHSNHAILIDGPNVIVRNNVFSDVGNDASAVRVAAADLTFEKNVVRDVVAQGMFLDATSTGAVIHANQFLRAGTESEAAIACGGASCTITSNVIREADGFGILIDANQIAASNNKVERCRSDGIHVDAALTGVTLTGNRCIGQLAEGIDVRSSGTVVTGNVAKQNRTDFVTSVMNFVIDPSNAFGTTGVSEVD